MFSTAKWALSSEAAESLAQMSARQAKGDTDLAIFVRERQDLVGKWQITDKRLIATRSLAPRERSTEIEKDLSSQLTVIDKRISEIDEILSKEFPEYTALVNSKPLTIQETQTYLREDDALVSFLDTSEWKLTPEETFIWVVTKDKSRWVRIDKGTKTLQRDVQHLRCGLVDQIK